MKNKIKGMNFEKKIELCINSGAFDFDKGDLKTDTHLIDAKYTERKSFSITTKILNKIWKEALERNKLPSLLIGIKEENTEWWLQVSIEKRKV